MEQINEVLRKTGHFLGYGILGALVFFALRNTNRDRITPLLLRRWGMYLHDFWRMEWAMLGMGVTVITASLDEIHQSFMPSRTGRWQDVVLDTCGAAVLQIIIYFFSLSELNRRREHLGQPEFSSTSIGQKQLSDEAKLAAVDFDCVNTSVHVEQRTPARHNMVRFTSVMVWFSSPF